MILVVLHAPLGRQKVIIATTTVGVIPADFRPGVIDGAGTLGRIEKPADLAEILVLLAPHRIVFVGLLLCEFGPRRGEAQAEMLGQPFNITLGQRNDGIGTTI